MADCGLRIAVCGAAGFAGALCAAIVQRHPSLELTLLTARSDAGRRHDSLYPRYRVPLEMHEFDADAVAEAADAALVAYPHGASAPAVKALRDALPYPDSRSHFATRSRSTFVADGFSCSVDLCPPRHCLRW